LAITQAQENVKFYTETCTTQPAATTFHNKRLELLIGLRERLPQFYTKTSGPLPFFPYSTGDQTPLLSSIGDTLQTSWPSTKHSEPVLQPPFSSETKPISQEINLTTEECSKLAPAKSDVPDSLRAELQKLRVNVEKPHKSREGHLKYLLNCTTQCYIDTTPTDFNKRRALTQKFANLTQLLDEIHQRFGEINLRQLIETTHDPTTLWTNAHLFGITESTMTAVSTHQLQSSKQFVQSILQQLSPEKDNKFYTQYQQDLCYLEKLHSKIELQVSEKSAGFSTPTLQAATTSPQIAPPMTTPFQAHNRVSDDTSNRQPPFQTNVNFSRSIPKYLLSQLDQGSEIQWSQITQATLAEFPHIDDKLKLKSRMHQMTQHKTARQTAAAQLLQAIREPTHNPLQAFFTWLQQSYGLTKQEKNR